MFYKLPWSWCLFTSKTVSQPICERWMQKDGAFKAIPSYAEGLRAVWAYWELISKGGKRERRSRKQWRSVGDRLVGKNTIEASMTTWVLSSVLGTHSKKDSVSFMKNLSTCAVRWAMETELTRNWWARQSGVCSVAETESGPCLNKAKPRTDCHIVLWPPNVHLPPKWRKIGLYPSFHYEDWRLGDIFALSNCYSVKYYSCMIPRWNALKHARTTMFNTLLIW